jgi:hypothetical protein
LLKNQANTAKIGHPQTALTTTRAAVDNKSQRRNISEIRGVASLKPQKRKGHIPESITASEA